jgi:hypothetical protein
MHSKTGIDVSAGLAELIEMEAPLAPFMATMLVLAPVVAVETMLQLSFLRAFL